MTSQERAAMVLEALETGRDAAYQIAQEYHQSMKGYRRRSHDTLDADVAKIDAAIVVLRAALDAPEPATHLLVDCGECFAGCLQGHCRKAKEAKP